MSLQDGRYAAARPPSLAEGWSLERLTPVSRAVRRQRPAHRPDGRIYVAQVTGSRISALDVGTGRLETISPMGSEIVAPDDVAFDPRGNLYATEVMDGRVSVRGVDGRSRVLRGDLPAANGITFHQGRLFIDECRMGGRLMELDLAGGAPRVLLENVPMPNALEAGPDGLLYFPVMGANEIWRIHPDGGAAERVVGDLGIPDAVKFDSKATSSRRRCRPARCCASIREPATAACWPSLDPGLDNLTFVGDRLFVSHLTDGRITEILGGGKTRTLLPGGLNWPLDLAMGDDGRLYVADGASFYVLPPGGKLQSARDDLQPGLSRLPARCGSRSGRAASRDHRRTARLRSTGPGTAERGARRRTRPALWSGGCARRGRRGRGARHGARAVRPVGQGRGAGHRPRDPGRGDRSGRRLPGLRSGGGTGRQVSGAGSKPCWMACSDPQGIAGAPGQLYIVDAGAKELIAFDLENRARRTIATGLPVGAPPGVIPKLLADAAVLGAPGPVRGHRRRPGRHALSFRPTPKAACWQSAA